MLFYLTFLFLVFVYNCSLERFIFSKYIEFTYLMNCLKFLLINLFLLNGQLPFLSSIHCSLEYLFRSLAFRTEIFKCYVFVVNDVTYVLSIRSLVHIVHL